MGFLSKKVYRIISGVLAAVALTALLCLAAALGGTEDLPGALLVGIAGTSGAAAVFAARKAK